MGEESEDFRYSVAGPVLTLTRTTQDDVDGDGVDDPVSETLVFQRR
jgi:hypothetical protein